MKTKAEEIELTLIQVSEAMRAAVYPNQTRAIVHVRRAFIGLRTIELPHWVVALWLLDGHWKETSAINMSCPDFIKELESLRDLAMEDA